jgi:hypothetical protein
LREAPGFSQNARKSGLNGCSLDITLGGSVQNILKKVKKRLVSPPEAR